MPCMAPSSGCALRFVRTRTVPLIIWETVSFHLGHNMGNSQFPSRSYGKLYSRFPPSHMGNSRYRFHLGHMGNTEQSVST